jgi:Tfp pilus assembly protein PilO
MKKYFSQLRPLERRLVIGVVVVLFIVLNWLFVKPHFSDWSDLSGRKAEADRKLKLYQTAVAQIAELQKQVKTFESAGQFVALEDQGVNFMRTVQAQSSQSGVALQNSSPPRTHTNDVFFVEQVQNINVLATEEQLVDFLYKLGSGSSTIRVRDLELQPDLPHQRLSANIRLVASYQKNPTPANAAKTATAKAK